MNSAPADSGGIDGVTLAKVLLAIGGAAIFGAGIRWESSTLRWVGIAVVGVGWVLRLLSRKQPIANPDESDSD